MSLIVNRTAESFSEYDVKEKVFKEVTERESNLQKNISSYDKDFSKSPTIKKCFKTEIKSHAIEHNLDRENSQINVQQEDDLLSDNVVKIPENLPPIVRLLPLIVKTGNSGASNKAVEYKVIFFYKTGNKVSSKCTLSVDNESHYCQFQCGLCPYTTKFRTFLGQHKQQVHRTVVEKDAFFNKMKRLVNLNKSRMEHFQSDSGPYRKKNYK